MQAAGDGQLVAEALRGDRAAFAALVGRHRDMVAGVCRGVLRGSSVALEDVLQEVVLTAWLNLNRLRNRERFGSWLAGIALNVARSFKRYEERQAWSSEALAGGRWLAEETLQAPDPADLMEQRELVEKVRAAVDQLPPGQRRAVIGYYLEGLTQVELAALIGTSPGAIRTRLHKARGALYTVLLPALKEEEAMISTSTIRMRIASVCQTSPSESGIQRYVVILDEEDGNRRLPIWVGEHEGIALAFALEDVPLPRPMTHQLTAVLLQTAGSRMVAVNITELVEGTYYATITLDTPSGRHQVDARPSDAMILATLSGAQVTVEADVLDQAMELHAATLPSADDVEREALAQTPQIVATRLTQMRELKEQVERSQR
ncbi:MAG: DUF151 domain-containing protein [Actinomycetota bacterium]|nr:DUF151 domain-containing protein [Actinomycetota bacterium]